jgi:HSP20 family protein
MQNSVAIKDQSKKSDGIAPRIESPLFYSLQEEMNHLFDNFRQGMGGGLSARRWFEQLGEFHPKLDVKNSDKEIIVTIELPGVELKDIEISVTGNGLLVKGEKRAQKEEKDKGYYKMECSYGSFQRLIPLPCEVKNDEIVASYKDGVVKVTLPKAKESLQDERKIDIKAE